MTNPTMFEMLLNSYNRFAYTDKYIIGFPYKGVVYYGFTTAETFDRFLSLDTSGHHQGFILRFKPRNSEKLAMLTACNMKPLVSVEYFNGLVADSKYNRGEMFEKLITEMLGQEWVKDCVPFNEAGDIEVDGVAYQIKYEKSGLATENTLTKLLKRAGKVTPIEL